MNPQITADQNGNPVQTTSAPVNVDYLLQQRSNLASQLAVIDAQLSGISTLKGVAPVIAIKIQNVMKISANISSSIAASSISESLSTNA